MAALPSDSDPSSDDEPAQPEASQESPYWGRRSFLDWFSGLETKGKFFFWGCFIVATNGMTWLFGFFFPKALFVGIGLILASFLIPADNTD